MTENPPLPSDPAIPPPLGDVAERLGRDPGWTPWPLPEVRETTGSTMADVAERAGAGAPEGFVVIAEQQEAGRGRMGRPWVSAPRSGLWLSVLLRPIHAGPTSLSRLPLVIGDAVVTALERQAAGSLRGLGLKWPNDVVVSTGDDLRKVGGILAERLTDGAVVVGIGINVSQRVDDLPPGATSVLAEAPTLGERTDFRTDLLVATLVEVARAYRAWSTHTWGLEEYRRRCVTLGRPVVVSVTGGDDITGTAIDVDEAGHLVVATTSGERIAVTAGDVSIRPA